MIEELLYNVLLNVVFEMVILVGIILFIGLNDDDFEGDLDIEGFGVVENVSDNLCDNEVLGK